MDNDIKEILDIITRDYNCVVVESLDRLAEIASCEKACGYEFPADMKQFYERFETATIGSWFKIFTLQEIISRREIFPAHSIPESWQIFSGDEDCIQFVAIDLNPERDDLNTIIDMDEESDGTYIAFAKNFTQYLQELIEHHGEIGFWNSASKKQLQRLRYEEGSDYYRVRDLDYWNNIDSTPGTLICKKENCSEKNISTSIFCKKHHYERGGIPCFFTDETIAFPGRIIYQE